MYMMQIAQLMLVLQQQMEELSADLHHLEKGLRRLQARHDEAAAEIQ